MNRSASIVVGLPVLCSLLFWACDGPESTLAPYEGDRPFIMQRVTQSAAPEIQWVGGRAAAVGVNLGDEAGLNENLVWIVTSEADDIGSPLRIGSDFDADLVNSLGGTPLDSLPSGADYTYWVASAEAMDAGLPTADPHAFVDTTLTLDYFVRGRSGGDPSLGVEFTIVRDQTIVEDLYTVYWTPETQSVRRLAIRNGTLGGFTDLVWHIVQDDEEGPDSILPPVVIGEAPPGTIEVQEWLGFEPANHVLWTNTSDWNGDSFGFRTEGYLFFQIFANNFE